MNDEMCSPDLLISCCRPLCLGELDHAEHAKQSTMASPFQMGGPVSLEVKGFMACRPFKVCEMNKTSTIIMFGHPLDLCTQGSKGFDRKKRVSSIFAT